METKNPQQIFKKLESVECPFCHKNFWVAFQSMLPYLSAITTDEEIEAAKKDLKDKISTSKLIPDKTKEDLYKYIDVTPLDKSDVEPLLQQVIKEIVDKQANNSTTA